MGSVLLRRSEASEALLSEVLKIFPALENQDSLTGAELLECRPELTSFAASGLCLVLGSQVCLLPESALGLQQENGGRAAAKRLKKSDSFTVDLTSGKLRWRIEHPGLEAVCKACLRLAELDHAPLVFDATAGLGRDSLVLASRGGVVSAFERNAVSYLLLFDALQRAQENGCYHFALPRLYFGQVQDLSAAMPKPDVIYYDPMFPSRSKSAQVKKDMQIFHQAVGFDEDTLSCARELLQLCRLRLVVKRPSDAHPLDLGTPPGSVWSISGGSCRFDCYRPGSLS